MLLMAMRMKAGAEAPAPVEFIDDEGFMKSLERGLFRAGDDGSAPRWSKLKEPAGRLASGWKPAAAPEKPVAAGPLYRRCADAVLAITSAWKNESGAWECGEPATAWVIDPRGIAVTNAHVFGSAREAEVFGVMTRRGVFHPVTALLARDEHQDVAIFRIPAEGLTALTLAPDEPVGNAVSVISHPDQQFYTFTQGAITRYTLLREKPEQPPVPYLCVSADFARGSSGGPVLNGSGAVVGMVCSTMTTYYGRKGEDPDDDVQMVVRFCIPARSMLRVLESLSASAERPAASADPR
jgi:hypothetical protein